MASEAPRIILDGLKEAGINLIASLPDINLAELLALIEEDEGITHVPVCREEEGIGIYYAGDVGDRGFSTSGAMTEPVLNSMGIRNYILRRPSEVKGFIQRAQVLTEDSKRPVALLLTKEALGRRPALT